MKQLYGIGETFVSPFNGKKYEVVAAKDDSTCCDGCAFDKRDAQEFCFTAPCCQISSEGFFAKFKETV